MDSLTPLASGSHVPNIGELERSKQDAHAISIVGVHPQRDQCQSEFEVYE